MFDGEQVAHIHRQVQNRVRQLIGEMTIATNGCTARYLAVHSDASLCNAVRPSECPLRVVAVAEEYGQTLPAYHDSKSLEAFLTKRHLAGSLRCSDLSLVFVWLMDSGKYVAKTSAVCRTGALGWRCVI